MWTSDNRERYNRDHLRYPSDLTDEEWILIEPLIGPAKRGGRKRSVDVRQVLNGVMYVLSTGCQWRYIPKDLPPRSTVHWYLDLWIYDGTLDRIHAVLYEKCRKQAERNTEPTACIIDSQSVKSAEKGGPASIRTGGACPRAGEAGPGECGKADQGQEAACSHRHAGPCPPDACSFRGNTGPGWWSCADGKAQSHVPVTPETLCRRSLSGTHLPPRAGQNQKEDRNRDRQTSRSDQGVCSPAQKVDRRTNPRMAQPMSRARQRLGVPQHQSSCFPPALLHQTHAQKTL